jgi:hypothetical protein
MSNNKEVYKLALYNSWHCTTVGTVQQLEFYRK